MNWSLEHYNFICYGSAADPIFEKPTGRSSFPAKRLFECTDHSLKELYARPEQLASLPTAVVAEVRQPATTPALLTRIGNVREIGSTIYFDYQHYVSGKFTSEYLFETLEDIVALEHYRTHWAVKRGNLVDEVFQLMKSLPVYPKVFNVSGLLQQRQQVAVMMPFCTTFDPVYGAIKNACEGVIKPVRVDDLRGPDVIVDSIFRSIEQALLVVADVTTQNANVLYEAGLAHGRNRDVVFLTQHPDRVPFDLTGIRHIKYEPGDEGLKRLTHNLNQAIVECLLERPLDQVVDAGTPATQELEEGREVQQSSELPRAIAGRVLRGTTTPQEVGSHFGPK